MRCVDLSDGDEGFRIGVVRSRREPREGEDGGWRAPY